MTPSDPITVTGPIIAVGVRGAPLEHRPARGVGKADRKLQGRPSVKLLTVGGRLAKRHGCGFGIDPLLAESECAKASLYTNYNSKDGLLAAICVEERAALERSFLGIDLFMKKPQAIMNVVTSTVLDAIGNPNSLVGVSLNVLITAPADTSRGGLPLAIRAAELTIKSFPKHLRDRFSSVPDLHLSDSFDAAAQEYFKALLLAAVTPRIFPAEKPEKQPALLSAIKSLAAEVAVRHYEAGAVDRVHTAE